MHRKALFYFSVVAIMMILAMGLIGCNTSSDTGGETPTPTPTATGTGVISGTVTDEVGAPLSGVTVEIGQDDGNALSMTKGDATTDNNGYFIIQNLATGQSHLVTISQSGRITAEITVELTDTESEATFTISLPQGDDTVTFILPKGLVLSQPTQDGGIVTLTWNQATVSSIAFNSNLLFRKATSGVTTADTLAAEITSSFLNSVTDTLPEVGRWHYRMFTQYNLDMNVSILVPSNEVQIYQDKYVLDMLWGGQGTGDGEFDRPYGVAIYETANGVEAVYVTDGDRNDSPYRIQIFDEDGTYLDQWTQYDDGGLTDFYTARGIDVDSSGNVYVAQGQYRQNIVKLDSLGTTLGVWTDLGTYSWPETWDVAVYEPVGGTPAVYGAMSDRRVSGDTGIFEFDIDGVFVDRTVVTTSSNPHGVAVGPDGSIVVVDADSDTLSKSSPDGTPIFQFEYFTYGGVQYELDEPHGVATDSSGNIYVTAREVWPYYFADGAISKQTSVNRYNVMKFDSEGNLITQIPYQFIHPHGIDVTADGNTIYVVDKEAYNVQKWVKDLEENE